MLIENEWTGLCAMLTSPESSVDRLSESALCGTNLESHARTLQRAKGIDALPIDTKADSDPFYPAAYFEQFNVTGDMLRQAIKTDNMGNAKIRSRKPGGRRHYSFNDVKRVWPHLMANAKRENA